MKPNAITAKEMMVTDARIVNCVQIRRDSRSELTRYMLVTPPVVGRDQRIYRGVRAGHLADGAAPLHLEFGKISFPLRPGEETAVQTAQSQVDDERDVGEVAPKPVGDGAFHPWQGRKEVQTSGQCGPGVGQLPQRGREITEVVDERLLALLDRGGGDGAELAHLVDCVDQCLARI